MGIDNVVIRRFIVLLYTTALANFVILSTGFIKYRVFVQFLFLLLNIVLGFMYSYLRVNKNIERGVNRMEPLLLIFAPFLSIFYLVEDTTRIKGNAIIPPLIVFTGIFTLFFVTFLVLVTFKSKEFKEKKKIEKISWVILSVIASFMIAYISIGCLNYEFARQGEITKHELIQKTIQWGYRSATFYNFYIKYQEKEYSLKLSIKVYHEFEIGEEVTVGYYHGLLGIDYIRYVEI